jgi:hypothetical protein
MTVKLDPLISEFETDDEARAYDLWFREKVQAAMSSPTPRIPHDEAMAPVSECLARNRSARAGAALD